MVFQVKTFSLKNNLMANDEFHLIKIIKIFVSLGKKMEIYHANVVMINNSYRFVD